MVLLSGRVLKGCLVFIEVPFCYFFMPCLEV